MTTYAPISHGVVATMVLVSLMLMLSWALRPSYWRMPIYIGLAGVLLIVVFDWLFVAGDALGGIRTLYFILPATMICFGLKYALPRMMEIEAIRVVSPPVILIVAVLGSILGGVTNPTAAAALGAAGAVMLAASRKLQDAKQSKPYIIWAALAVILVVALKG